MQPRGMVIGGIASGSGKTTVASGLIAALARRGLAVQPFKAGPDYIDPSHLSGAAGRACRTLDSWMLSMPVMTALFMRAAARADVSVVEGVMGLFDGRSAQGERGSTAEIAKRLGLPVVLVIDAGAMARSAAAVVIGCERFDPDLPFAGIILNRVAGAGHAALCREAIASVSSLPVFGWLPRDPKIAVPERHLGLVPRPERPDDGERLAHLADLVERHVDLDALLAGAAPVEGREADAMLFPDPPVAPRVQVAIARDRAFNFYYEDSLDLLSAAGAELVPFSPLIDHAVPAGCGAIYIGGGFPEMFAGELAANRVMLQSLRAAAAAGVEIYGECGGLMYLGRRLRDLDGRAHEMAGLVPLESEMAERLTLGYREAESCGTPLLPAGERVRGHEFHWSRIAARDDDVEPAYRLLPERERADGARMGSVTATYLHVHLAARPELAGNFVAAAARAGVTA